MLIEESKLATPEEEQSIEAASDIVAAKPEPAPLEVFRMSAEEAAQFRYPMKLTKAQLEHLAKLPPKARLRAIIEHQRQLEFKAHLYATADKKKTIGRKKNKLQRKNRKANRG